MTDDNKALETGHESKGSSEASTSEKGERTITVNPSVKRDAGYGGINLSKSAADRLNGVFTETEPPAKEKAEALPEKGQEEEAKEAGESSKEATEKPVEADAKKGSEFFTAVTNKLTELNLSEDDQKAFIDDALANWPKFRKVNTEKSMALAEREKELGDLELLGGLKNFIQTDKVKTILERISKDPETLESFKTDLNGYFGGEDNPVAELLDLMFKAAPEAEKVTTKQKELDDREADLEIENHTIQLKGMDKRYLGENGDTELQATIDVALKEGVNLLTAHKIRMGESVQAELDESKKKNKILNDELIATKKQLEELKKKTPAPPDTVDREPEKEKKFPVQTSVVAMRRDAMDQAERKIREKLKVA